MKQHFAVYVEMRAASLLPPANTATIRISRTSHKEHKKKKAKMSDVETKPLLQV